MNTQLQRMRDALVAAGFPRQAAEEALQERMNIRDTLAAAALTGLLARRFYTAPSTGIDEALKYADAYLTARIPK